jgi:hypothetical protein
MPTRVTADWMAQQWRDQKRLKKKLGSYPSVSLAQAREIFQRDFADMIQKGRSIKIAGDTRPGTVADLVEAYVKYLRDAQKPSWKETEKGLNKIADTLGRNRPAREIEPEEIVEVIRPIYDRGKRAMPTKCEATSALPTVGASSRSTTTGAPPSAASGLSTTPRPAYRPNRRRSAHAGSTKMSSSGSTAGSNARTRLSIRPTREPCVLSC